MLGGRGLLIGLPPLLLLLSCEREFTDWSHDLVWVLLLSLRLLNTPPRKGFVVSAITRRTPDKVRAAVELPLFSAHRGASPSLR